MSRRAAPARPRTAQAPAAPVLSVGRPLDNPTNARMSSRFGHDFSSVRIHTDARAEESAQSLGAGAYALGNDIAFGPGQYAPGRPDTERLLAHELTHVVQQAQYGPGDPSRQSRAADASEREAGEAADKVLAGESVDVRAAPQAAVARWGLDDYNPNPTPTLPDGPLHWGNQPADKGVSGPYAYSNYDPINIGGQNVPGGGGGVGLFHGRGDIGGVPVGDDLAFANTGYGAMRDGDGNTRFGVKGNAGLVSMDFNKGGQVSGDVQALNANAEASFGDDGATLGAGASLLAGSVSGHDDHQAARLGLSYGVGMAGRTHWGQDKDGFRNYGAGADVGPFSFDFQTNDPLRSSLGLLPGGGLLPGLMGVGDKDNMTEGAANRFGLSTKNADLGTTWDAAKSIAGGAYNGVSDTASSAYNGISNAASSAYNGAASTASAVYNGASSTASAAYNGVADTASSVWNQASSAISGFDPSQLIM